MVSSHTNQFAGHSNEWNATRDGEWALDEDDDWAFWRGDPENLTAYLPVGYREVVKVGQRKQSDRVLATIYLYDDRGQLSDVWLPGVDVDPDPETTNLVRPHWHYEYDQHGNQLSQTDPNGNVTSFGYDEQGRRTSRTLPEVVVGVPASVTESWTYDGFGRTQTHTDFKGQTTAYVYSNTDEHGGRLMYEYRYAAGATQPVYTGDNDEELDNPEDAAERTAYVYDDLGRQTQVRDERPAASPDFWDSPVVDTATNTAYDPDTGEMISVGTILDGDSLGTVNYEYDKLGRKTRTYTANNDTSYTYDKQGRLETLHVTELNGDTVDLTTTYSYDISGNLESTEQKDGSDVVMTTTHTYDNQNRLTYEEVTNGDDEVIATYSYTLDHAGLRTAVVEHQMNVDNMTFSDVKVSYAYNQNGRLNREFRDVATYSGPTPVFSSTPFTPDSDGDFVDTYAFDLNGNRLSKEHEDYGTNDYTATYEYNDRDQLIEEDSTDNSKDKSYEYDANGSQIAVEEGTTPTVTNYVWDLRNRMVGIDLNDDGDASDANETGIMYDSNSVRIAEITRDGTNTPTGTYSVNDPYNLTGYPKALEEKSTPTGDPDRSYILGHKVEGQSDSTNGTLLLQTDGHGSTRGLFNLSGLVVERYDYDAPGSAIGFVASSAKTKWLFGSGGFYDKPSEGYVSGRRIYQTANGSWMSRDPRGEVLGDFVNANLYSFVGGNPVNLVDPSGLFSIAELGVVGTINAVIFTAMFSPVTPIIVNTLAIISLVTFAADPKFRNEIIAATGGDLSQMHEVFGGSVTYFASRTMSLAKAAATAAFASRFAPTAAEGASALVMEAAAIRTFFLSRGMSADTAAGYADSFAGGVGVLRKIKAGESFLRYSGPTQAGSGSFLTKTTYQSSSEAVSALDLSRRFGNDGSMVQRVISIRDTYILEGNVARGAPNAYQAIAIERDAFEFGTRSSIGAIP